MLTILKLALPQRLLKPPGQVGLAAAGDARLEARLDAAAHYTDLDNLRLIIGTRAAIYTSMFATLLLEHRAIPRSQVARASIM